MEPISAVVLAALAGGLAGEAGRDAWTALAELVRRPFQRGRADEQADGAETGSAEAELLRLAEAPANPERAQQLSTALAVRSALDSDFRAHLNEWVPRARRAHEAAQRQTGVTNVFSAQEQNAPVFQARDIHNLTIPYGPTSPGNRDQDNETRP
ncbi:hypothetical protein [Streptomyces sp. DH8]|uniref:hypothetical protein n=1 Tax=Streptomyces sp. DH8 TaxID=2857008 RepID=UPI001E2BADC4|nr:hypothetical protein [Streptomyces sp. DH8]